jgi:hypothetical protein
MEANMPCAEKGGYWQLSNSHYGAEDVSNGQALSWFCPPTRKAAREGKNFF